MLSDEEILSIAEALRVAYMRGGRDPQHEHMLETIHELRDFIIAKLEG